jgi:hypothetical protein
MFPFSTLEFTSQQASIFGLQRKALIHLTKMFTGSVTGSVTSAHITYPPVLMLLDAIFAAAMLKVSRMNILT